MDLVLEKPLQFSVLWNFQISKYIVLINKKTYTVTDLTVNNNEIIFKDIISIL